MARSQGEIRQALAEAAHSLIHERGCVIDGVAVDGVTWRDLAMKAQVGWGAARTTVNNMARAGDLARIGKVKPANSERWMTVFAPAELVPDDQWPQPWGGIELLVSALRPEGTEGASD